jgi:hypothetical protein
VVLGVVEGRAAVGERPADHEQLAQVLTQQRAADWCCAIHAAASAALALRLPVA